VRFVAQPFGGGVAPEKQQRVGFAIEMQCPPIAALDFGTGM
jgi:hypothetical protein